jgi:uncharacterized protein (TIGR02118 family)
MENATMIKLSAFYPNQPDAKFDMEYYIQTHIPMVLARCGADAKPGGVERALEGGAFGMAAPYCTAGHLLFESREAMERSFGAHIPEILADLPNFTNLQPVLQISEVVLDVGQAS